MAIRVDSIKLRRISGQDATRDNATDVRRMMYIMVDNIVHSDNIHSGSLLYA